MRKGGSAVGAGLGVGPAGWWAGRTMSSCGVGILEQCLPLSGMELCGSAVELLGRDVGRSRRAVAEHAGEQEEKLPCAHAVVEG